MLNSIASFHQVEGRAAEREVDMLYELTRQIEGRECLFKCFKVVKYVVDVIVIVHRR